MVSVISIIRRYLAFLAMCTANLPGDENIDPAGNKSLEHCWRRYLYWNWNCTKYNWIRFSTTDMDFTKNYKHYFNNYQFDKQVV